MSSTNPALCRRVALRYALLMTPICAAAPFVGKMELLCLPVISLLCSSFGHVSDMGTRAVADRRDSHLDRYFVILGSLYSYVVHRFQPPRHE